MASKKSKNNQATNSGAALASCEDLMLCVLARLPVKSICRFKSVCESWNDLLSTQEFIKMKFKLSNESKNQSFLVHTVDWNGNGSTRNNFFVFNILDKKANILDYPFDYTCVGFDIGIRIVGCCNGLVCIKHVERFVLWNPAMNLCKTVLPLEDWFCKSYSIGFGYDAEGDDFKVVRILLKYKRRLNNRRRVWCVSYVEVYSVNSDSWTTIYPGFEFSELGLYCIVNNATMNGNPCWFGKVGKNDVLVCFDMSKLVFKFVPLSSLDYNKAEHDIEFVDLNGSLGALVFTRENQWKTRWKKGKRIEYIGSWVFDDGEQIWTKSHSVGPIKVEPDQVLRCLKDGRVLGKRPNGQLVVFNSEKCVKDLFNFGHNFRIYDYTASMAYIKGMEKVALRKTWL
ncbi:hypothetical protein CASFOL_027842 [Castilleja foliolosa]|uniref:F-box domain-containing protein n=1 Tax=Castilleja foliolosa TaxID=1961234 RepID=A0ABD3CIK1_9LAMI